MDEGCPSRQPGRASAECIPANGEVRGNQKIFEGLGA